MDGCGETVVVYAMIPFCLCSFLCVSQRGFFRVIILLLQFIDYRRNFGMLFDVYCYEPIHRFQHNKHRTKYEVQYIQSQSFTETTKNTLSISIGVCRFSLIFSTCTPPSF